MKNIFKIVIGIVLACIIGWFFIDWPNGLKTTAAMTGLPEGVTLVGAIIIIILGVLLYMGILVDEPFGVIAETGKFVGESLRSSWNDQSEEDKFKAKVIAAFLAVVLIAACFIINAAYPEIAQSFFPSKPTPTATQTPVLMTLERTYEATDRVTALQYFLVECKEPSTITIKTVPNGIEVFSTTCQATP